MLYEDPGDLLRRLALGREEFCQRLLTALILGGTYPKWNSRSEPCESGTAFLRALDVLSFGSSDLAAPIVFVDELDLPRRHDGEKGGAPDYAVLSEGRVWIIELKSERGSHRLDQIPSYFRLGAHHYPAARLDITYLTPALTKPHPMVLDRQRYSHVVWSDVEPLILDAWGDAEEPAIGRVRDGLLEALRTLDEPVKEWRAKVTAARAADAATIEQQGRLTAVDGKQRGVDIHVEDLDRLQELRMEVRDRFAADSELARVRPWIWSAATSGGQALTAMGMEHGYELRLSRYSSLG